MNMNEIHAIGCPCARCHAPMVEVPPEVIDTTARAELAALRERVERLERFATNALGLTNPSVAEKAEREAVEWKARAEKAEREFAKERERTERWADSCDKAAADRDSARVQLTKAMGVVEAARIWRARAAWRTANFNVEAGPSYDLYRALAAFDGVK